MAVGKSSEVGIGSFENTTSMSGLSIVHLRLRLGNNLFPFAPPSSISPLLTTIMIIAKVRRMSKKPLSLSLSDAGELLVIHIHKSFTQIQLDLVELSILRRCLITT